MHSTILSVIAVILIITSFICLILLLKWRNMKFGIFSSLYVLATSDLLSDIILAIILLLNRYNVINFFQSDEKNGTLKNIENSDYNEFLTTPTNCNLSSVLLHYALFLVPFASSFVSLLGKTLHCNYYIKRIEIKCSRFTVDSSHCINSGQFASIPRSGSKKKHKYTLTILTVISQWIIPIILVVILYIGGYNDYNMSSRSHDSICIYTMNFPLDDNYKRKNENIVTVYDGNNINDINNSLLHVKNNKLDNYKSTRLHLAKSSRPVLTINNIVSKIREIVQSVQNVSELIINKSSIDSNPQLTNNLAIMELYNLTYSEPVELDENTDPPVIKDLLYDHIQNKSVNTYDLIFQLNITGNSCKTEYMNPVCMKNWCFISPIVLKIHLIVSLFIVYFGTIFVFIILYIKCQYIYSGVMEKLKVTDDTDVMTNITITPSAVLKKRLNIDCITGQHDDSPCHSQKSDIKVDKFINIRGEADNIKKFAITLRTTFVFAASLWTPVLLDILAKVFLCFQIPNWLTNILYLFAMSFEIIRNISNIHIINNKRILPEIWMKHNSIYPISNLSAQQQ